MKKKWIIVLVVALAAVLLVVIVAAIALRDQNTEQPGGASSSEQTSSSESSVSQDSSGAGEDAVLTYAEFLEMTPDQQAAFQDSFASGADYVAWFWDAYDAWEAEQDANKIIIDGNNPVIDAGDLIGGNS